VTREETVAFLERRQAAYDRRDATALAADHAPDGTVDSPTAGGNVRGRAAIEEIYRAWFKAFPDVVLEDEHEPLIDGDRIALVSTLTGTDLGGFMEMPPTGKQFRLRVVRLYTVSEGLIVSERRIYDFTGMLVQIGVLKAKPA
jgi:predicted ester cyclase